MVIPMPALPWPEAEPYSVLEYRLDEARTEEEVNYPGDNITAATNGSLAGISIKFQSKRNKSVPLDQFNPISYPSGFQKFYLTNTAQAAGKKLYIFIGRAAGAAAPTVTFAASQTVKISGETVIAQVSGERVRIEGYDYASGEHREVAVSESGQIEIKVTVADIVTAKISGETVIAKISGEMVTAASGAHVLVSGQMVAVASGAFVLISGQQVIAKVSGEIVSVASGAYVLISGQMVAVASGAFVQVSGQQVIAKISGETVKISGETVDIQAPTAVKTGAFETPTLLSGGTIVTSGAVKSATFKALSGDVYVGGTATGDMPYSGYGFLLTGGEAVSLDIDNFGRVRLCAPVASGDWVSRIGVF